MKFTEIPRRLQVLLAPPDPIVIHHLIKCAQELVSLNRNSVHVTIPFLHCSVLYLPSSPSLLLSVLSFSPPLLPSFPPPPPPPLLLSTCSADAPDGKRTACYDIEVEIVSIVNPPYNQPVHWHLLFISILNCTTSHPPGNAASSIPLACRIGTCCSALY